MVGGVVAEKVDAASIKGVVSKWAALKWLKQQAALAPAEANLTTGNQRYAIGDRVKIEMKGAKYPHLTMFNLPPDGHVEFFIPDPEQACWRPPRIGAARPIREEFKVDRPPYGAEHMVAIFSKDDLPDLHAALQLDDDAGAVGGLAAGARTGAVGQGRADRHHRHLYWAREAETACFQRAGASLTRRVNRSCGVQLRAAKETPIDLASMQREVPR